MGSPSLASSAYRTRPHHLDSINASRKRCIILGNGPMTSILVVDDDQQIRNLLSSVLERSGYKTIIASNGKEAVTQYREIRPDMIITDIVMPEKDGIETIQEIRQINPKAKIIAMSGGGQIKADVYLSLAKNLGAGAILEKPFRMNELLLHIRAALADG